jgi:hypothetical protein
MKLWILLLIILVSGCSIQETPPQDFHSCLEHHHSSRAASECHIPHH